MIGWVAVLFLIAASIADLRSGEIPERVSAGFIALVLAVAALQAAREGSIRFLTSSVVMGFLFFAFAYLVYRLGQWGGGDVKLMGGIGCALGLMDALGFHWPNARIMPYPLSFIVGMGVLSLPYALVYSMILTAKKPDVLSEFRTYVSEPAMKALLACAFAPSVAAYFMNYRTLAGLYLSIPAVLSAIIYLKAVEEKTLKKRMPVSELAEGDVLAEDVVVDGVRIKSEHAIEGLSSAQAEQIRELAREGKIPPEVLVKWGLRFAPILLLSFAVTVWVGNLLEMLFLSVVF